MPMVGRPATGPLVHDAQVAALCLSHGVREQWTADRDFGKCPGVNPLVRRSAPLTALRRWLWPGVAAKRPLHPAHGDGALAEELLQFRHAVRVEVED